MAITRVGASQATSNVSVGGTTGVNLTRTAGTINNLLIVAGYVSSVTAVPTISDTQGNTWNPCNPDFSDATNATRLISWYALAKNTLSTIVTVKNTDATTHFWGMTLEEFTGTDTTSPLDQVNHSTAGASGANHTGPSITLGANDCLVWALSVDGVTAVGNLDGSAATKGADDLNNDWTEFRILTGRTGVSVSAAWTNALGAFNDFSASFKPASSAVTTAQEIPMFDQALGGQWIGQSWDR